MKKPKNTLLQQLIGSLNKEIHDYQMTKEAENPGRYNRREFVTHLAKDALGLGLILSLPSFVTACKRDTKKPITTDTDTDSDNPPILDVAILGGGVAGLNCANHLLGSGLNFTVFEASKRLGGRILTHYNDSLQLGIFPEFGGDFIDSTHADMLALAKEFKLNTIDLEAERKERKLVGDIFYFDNRKISEKEIIKEFKKIVPKIAKDAVSLGENYDTPEAKILDNTSLEEYIKGLKCKQWMKDLLMNAYVSEFGLDCSEQSAINFLDMIDTSTGNGFHIFGDSDERYRIEGGNSKIIEKLTEKVGEDKIERLYEVAEINENTDGNYQIVFTNGREYLAKNIVCTIPFTILRKLKINLKNMSPEKRKCIDELGYGMNTKLVLGYEGSPWSEKPNSATGHLYSTDIVNGWDGSHTKTENNKNSAYICFFGGKYSMDRSNESFKNPMAPPTHVWRTELPQESVDKAVGQLDHIFIGSKKKFLNKHVFVNWIDYPYTHGSYSCYKKGQWTTIAGLEIAPVGNFYFAGEHCSRDFQGYMNGGAETGRRAAESLIATLKKSKSL
jgi:monoamine oxidase